MQNVAGSNSQMEWTDERLLREYVASRDAGAFAAIVRRHGGLVFKVCLRLLGREQDAEDAFQATFLVLMRKAPSLRRPELLGNWLYGVAYRVASKLRAANSRRRTREGPMVDLPAPEADDQVSWRDLRPVLDNELQRLPARYRQPIVLFYLEGKSADEVAIALGRPRGTILSQLARARERLRVRLARRELAFSAGALATLLESTAPSDAAVPDRLLDWALHNLSPTSGVANVSAQANLLAQQVLGAMYWRRLGTMAALFLLALLLIVSVGIVCTRAIHAPQEMVFRADTNSDMNRLQGDWRVVAVESDGQVLPRDRFPFDLLKIRDDTILHEGGVHNQEMSIRLYPEQEPKAMDMQSRGYHTDVFNAIYALEGDTLTICRPDEGQRPAEFASRPGSKILLYTAKRIRPVVP